MLEWALFGRSEPSSTVLVEESADELTGRVNGTDTRLIVWLYSLHSYCKNT